MINSRTLGQLIAEDIINERGICFYPGSFKPPHKGHLAALTNLTSRSYIVEVVVLISAKTKEGITPEDSLGIWRMYMDASPNPKVVLRISEEDSPIKDIIKYLSTHKDTKAVYIAGGDDEKDDQSYLKDLQMRYPGVVKAISVKEKAGRVSAPYVRNLLRAQDREAFKETIPIATYNKGYFNQIYNLLIHNITDIPAEQEPTKQELPADEPAKA